MYHAPLEPTIPELQAQIDRLSLVVQQARAPQMQLEPMAQQLSQLAERCAEILNRWSDTDQRHAVAVSEVEERLGEWSAIEGRLHESSSQRLRELEQTIEREWKTLRDLHEEPVKQLREQAAALGEICVSAANIALQGFERAEARIATLESSLHGRLDQLSTDLQTALAAPRDGALATPPSSPVEAFPLEGVMRIHEGLRRAEGADENDAQLPYGAPEIIVVPENGVPERYVPRQLAAFADPLATRVQELEREVNTERQEVRESATRTERLRRDWRMAFLAIAAVTVVGAGFAIAWQQRVNARLEEAATRVAAAEQQAQAASDAATRAVSSTRADADRQITEARQSALRADIVSGVLAAPDLLRFNLVGGADASRFYAQGLWSRSRGLVLSAPFLPKLQDGSVYQVWFLSNGTPVNAATFLPDPMGRVSLATENPPDLPRPINGMMVTVEPNGGQPAPTGQPLLSRVEAPPTADQK